MGDPTSEQLHWNQLRKQFLLDEKPSDYYGIVRAQLGLHSTDYWTPYLSIWARIGDFDAKHMFESIDNGRKLVRTHAFRTTIHVMHIDNLSMILSATGPSLYRAYRTDKYRKVDILSDQEIEDMLTSVKEALKDEPLRTSALKKAVPDVGEHVRSALLMLMARGEVVRAKASHARSNLTSYALLEQWVDDFQLDRIDELEARTSLIKHHIERFGPVSIDDIAWWLRLTKTAVKNAISSLEEHLTKVNVDERACYLTKSDYKTASTLEEPKEDVVWFLPYEDHFLKAFIDRSRFISEDI
ncbi:MAG: crosslink repair DNA glycosylase YcaQ family protein, partial [Candidatus Thorarchaeota archaeon]